MVSNLFSGFAIDKLGLRLGYSLCMAFWTTATILQALATLPFHFGLFRALLGVGEAGNWPAGIKLTSEWFPPEERSTATGIFNSGAAIGAMVAPPLIAWLGTSYGWRATFIIIGLFGYLWVALFWFKYYTPERMVKESKREDYPAFNTYQDPLCFFLYPFESIDGPDLVFHYLLDRPVSWSMCMAGVWTKSVGLRSSPSW